MSTGARSAKVVAGLRKAIKHAQIASTYLRRALTKKGSMAFSSGNAAVDRYIAEGYDTVRGMSSRFAATICGHVIRRQTELGIKGHIAEIGTFEGRFFIAMALGIAPGEHALGIDTFNWPNDGLLDLFHSHCARLGLARERYTAIKANVRDLSAKDITARSEERRVGKE